MFGTEEAGQKHLDAAHPRLRPKAGGSRTERLTERKSHSVEELSDRTQSINIRVATITAHAEPSRRTQIGPGGQFSTASLNTDTLRTVPRQPTSLVSGTTRPRSNSPDIRVQDDPRRRSPTHGPGSMAQVTLGVQGSRSYTANVPAGRAPTCDPSALTRQDRRTDPLQQPQQGESSSREYPTSFAMVVLEVYSMVKARGDTTSLEFS